MGPLKTILLLITISTALVSALPATGLQPRQSSSQGSCPSGYYRIKLYTKNSNGQMVWTGQYVHNSGGLLRGNSDYPGSLIASRIDSNGNWVVQNPQGPESTVCVRLQDGRGQGLMNVLESYLTDCQDMGYPPVSCIQTPQYSLCSSAQNKYVQQCGERLYMVSSLMKKNIIGETCGPSLSFFIAPC